MQRLYWPSRLIFIFAAVGSAAGLGNLWRFPYLAYKYGGGAFLVPYILALLVLGIPLLILEFAIGQTFQRAAVASMRKIKPWAGTVAWWAYGCGFIILSYYAVIMSWSLYFLVSGGAGEGEDSADYFYSQVLQLSPSIDSGLTINLQLLFYLVVIWILIYGCIRKGIRSVSEVVKITMPLPIILVFVLLIRAVTLPGADSGLVYYVQPVFSALLDPEVWLAAASQIFFTLTLGFGVMITYSSHLEAGHDTAGNALWTAVLNSGISIVAGFVVFATLGFLASQRGVAVPDVVQSGPGLAFVVFPEALSLMPLPWLFSALFFIVLLTLGIDSAFSLIESFTAAFREYLDIGTERIAQISSIACFCAGLPFITGTGLYWLDIADHFITNYALVSVAIAQTLIVGWTGQGHRVVDHLRQASPWFPATLWWWTIRAFIPVLLLAMMLAFFYDEIQAPYSGYPAWTIGVGWCCVFTPMLIGLWLNRRCEIWEQAPRAKIQKSVDSG